MLQLFSNPNIFFMKKHLWLSGLFIFLFPQFSFGQILFPESFNLILDSTKVIQGSIRPDIKFRTQKRDLFEFSNTADVSFRLGKNHAMTVANEIEISRYGEEVLLSGGYLYVEYRQLLDRRLSIEPFLQLHWSEARGLEFKYAGGINARWRIFVSGRGGLFLGTGPFFEFERWNYEGVPYEIELPDDITPLEQKNIKLGTYLSLKLEPFDNIFLDFSAYHQGRFDALFSTPRLASSTMLTYKFTRYLGLSLEYQNIFDPEPLVPIRKDFHKVKFGLTVSF